MQQETYDLLNKLGEGKKENNKTHVVQYPISILEYYSDEDLIKLYKYGNATIQFIGGYDQYSKLQERLKKLGLE